MPWLEPFDWNYPIDLPAQMADDHPPFLLWTSETTFSLFWLTPVLDPDDPEVIWPIEPARQEFSVISGAIEPVGAPVRLPHDPGVGTNPAYVVDAYMAADGTYALEFADVGGS